MERTSMTPGPVRPSSVSCPVGARWPFPFQNGSFILLTMGPKGPISIPSRMNAELF